MTEKKPYHSGFVAIVGRPNVGKSTLMNAMIGEKIAIVSPKPQTTRSRLMGVMTGEGWQIVFLDTPGIHTPRSRLGEYMMQSVRDAMDGVELLMVMLDAAHVTDADRKTAVDLAAKKTRKVLVLNKLDLIQPEQTLRLMEEFSKIGYETIVPVSAKTGDGLEELRSTLVAALPEGPQYFPDDMITDQPERQLCAELIREKALNHLRDEVPHGIGVEMMAMRQVRDDLMEIHATIYCEREAHKGIIIGKGGAMLRTVGSEARADIERLLDQHVDLQLWVKVRPDWRNRVEDLRNLGYDKKN